MLLCLEVVYVVATWASEEGDLKWVLAPTGVECAAACLDMGRECDEAAWPETLEAWEGVAQQIPGLWCKGSEPGNWRHNPSVCTENWFLSSRGGMCFWQGGPGPRCSGGLDEFPTHIAQRVCPCRLGQETSMMASETMQVLNIAGVLAKQRLRTPLKIPADIGISATFTWGSWGDGLPHVSFTVGHPKTSQTNLCQCNEFLQNFQDKRQGPACCKVTSLHRQHRQQQQVQKWPSEWPLLLSRGRVWR